MNCFFDSEFYGLLESYSVFTTIISWSGCKAGESGDKYDTCPSIRFVTLTCKKSIKLVSWIIEDIYAYQHMFGYLCLHMIRSLLGLLVLPFSFMSRLQENFMVCVVKFGNFLGTKFGGMHMYNFDSSFLFLHLVCALLWGRFLSFTVYIDPKCTV